MTQAARKTMRILLSGLAAVLLTSNEIFSVASIRLTSFINPNLTIELGQPGDGLILVDYWAYRRCDSHNDEFTDLAIRTNEIAKTARALGIQVFHALGGSNGNDQKKLVDNFWSGSEKKYNYIQKNSLKMVAQILRSKPKTVIDLGPSRKVKDALHCEDEIGDIPTNRSMHPAISVDREHDVLFDSGFYFDRMKVMGIKRLFYTGMALNRCVLYTRKYSALSALLSGKFDQVGIITNLTVPIIQAKRQSRCLSGILEEMCKEEFATTIGPKIDKLMRRKTRLFWKLN